METLCSFAFSFLEKRFVYRREVHFDRYITVLVGMDFMSKLHPFFWATYPLNRKAAIIADQLYFERKVKHEL